MEKQLTTIEAINVYSWYKQNREDAELKKKLDSFSFKTQWNLKKNMDRLAPIVKSFEEFRAEQEEKIKEEFFGEDKSCETTVTQIENGEEVEVPVRKVRDEFIEDYTLRTEELNRELQSVLFETNNIAINTINLENEMDNLSDAFTMDDIDVLSFMLEGDE